MIRVEQHLKIGICEGGEEARIVAKWLSSSSVEMNSAWVSNVNTSICQTIQVGLIGGELFKALIVM